MKHNNKNPKPELISKLILLKNNISNEHLDKHLNAEYVFMNLRSFAAMLTQFIKENFEYEVLIIVKNKEQKVQIEKFLLTCPYKKKSIRIVMQVRRLKQTSVPKLAIIFDKDQIPSVKSIVTQFMPNMSYIFFCIYGNAFLDRKKDPALGGKYSLQGSFYDMGNLALLLKLVFEIRANASPSWEEEYARRRAEKALPQKLRREAKKKVEKKPEDENY